ncbi:MAG: ribosomal protein L13e [Nitrospinae bacterium]|nr:ribosomal protein L13e [Nitrospinota bacterium]
MPPPTAIEPGVPYSAEDTEGKSYGAHMELELLSADEPSHTDSTNGVDAGESDPAPALEPLTAPVSGEPPDAAETPRGGAPFEEYGLDLEPLREPEADESPDGVETSGQDDEGFSAIAESVKEATSAEPEIPKESEPEAVDESVQEVEEPSAASDVVETRDTPAPQSEAALYEEYGLDLEALNETESEATPEDTEPSLQEPSLEDEAAASEAVDSVAEASAPEPEVPQETEPEAVDEIVQEVEEAQPVSALKESTDKSPEPSIAENGFLPLVRDARGDWRPGKGFSRSELREVGLSPAEAASLHIRVDKRRRNAHPVNIATLERAKSGV